MKRVVDVLCMYSKLMWRTNLEPFHSLWVLVSLDLAGHQQLSSGGCDLLGWRDELLFTGVSLHCRVGCLTQIVGSCCNHSSLSSRDEQRSNNSATSRSFQNWSLYEETYSRNQTLRPLSIIHCVGWDCSNLKTQHSLDSNWIFKQAIKRQNTFKCWAVE